MIPVRCNEAILAIYLASVSGEDALLAVQFQHIYINYLSSETYLQEILPLKN